MRKLMASASAMTPSASGAVEAPVSTLTLKSSPRPWNALAFSAMAVGRALG